ncbi:MAG: hypothetical protein BWX66_00952 [Deltaproteobacteria bacterium ADurb.Bin058]|nr:MAG: hypothetical protein BWX66_00952 [Deltaproteobacteria bacterium ADurb.Bin058]
MGKAISVHQVGPGQILVGRINAKIVFARNLFKHRQASTGSNKNRVVAFVKQVSNRLGLPNGHVELYLNTKRP